MYYSCTSVNKKIDMLFRQGMINTLLASVSAYHRITSSSCWNVDLKQILYFIILSLN